MAADIDKYNKALGHAEREIALELCARIAKTLPKAEGKVWHGHPVWFIDAKALTSCLKSAKTIQWDYANLPKKRKLEKLTSF